jgi:hypothetical protein
MSAIPDLPELPMLTWALFSDDPPSPAELAFLTLQLKPKDYADWCTAARKSWTSRQPRGKKPT